MSSTGLKLPLRSPWGEEPPNHVDRPDIEVGLQTDYTDNLATTALEAIHELVARAYHGWVDESTPAADLESEMPVERAPEDTRLGESGQKDDQRPDASARRLTEKMRRDVIAKKRAKALEAARALAEVGIEAAVWLEYLSERRSDLLKQVAPHCAVLPFNLGLSRPGKGGKRGLLRHRVAKAHLTKLNLGVACHPVAEKSKEIEGKRSVFRLAAEQVLNCITHIKAHPTNWLTHSVTPTPTPGKCFEKRPIRVYRPSRWMKKLSALQAPMKRANWRAWWDVARVLLCEQWDQNIAGFSLLIKDSGLEEFMTPPKNKPSRVKSRIIDQMVKKEFERLAI